MNRLSLQLAGLLCVAVVAGCHPLVKEVPLKDYQAACAADAECLSGACGSGRCLGWQRTTIGEFENEWPMGFAAMTGGAGGAMHFAYQGPGGAGYGRWAAGAPDVTVDGETESIFTCAPVLDRQGRPLIPYRLGGLPRLATLAGDVWAGEPVDTAPWAPLGALVAADGTIHLIGTDGAQGSLDAAPVLHAFRPADGPWTIETIATGRGGWDATTLVQDAAGALHTAFTLDGFLQHAKRDASGWRLEPVTKAIGLTEELLAEGPQVALDAAGAPRVLFRNTNKGLQTAVRTGGAWTTTTLAVQAGAWRLGVDAQDRTRVAFYDSGGVGHLWIDSAGVHVAVVRSGTETVNRGSVTWLEVGTSLVISPTGWNNEHYALVP